MPPEESPLWNKCCVNLIKQANGDRSWNCLFCGRYCSGTKTRLTAHLVATARKGIKKCPLVPDEIKKEVLTEIGGSTTSVEHEVSEEQYAEMETSSMAASSYAGAASSGSYPILGREGSNSSPLVPSPTLKNSAPKKQQTLRRSNALTMQRKHHANIMEVRCIVEANLSFNLLKTPCWRNMVEAFSVIGEKHQGITYNHMRNKGLKDEVMSLHDKTGKIRALWPKYGCSILTDGWVDVCHRQLVNVLVSCCYGTMFLKSIDCSHLDITVDSTWLAEKISEAIKEVGKENVVQVISDNASNCVRMGSLLEEEFPHLVWTPCASHCLDLLLEDIGDLPWMENVVVKANAIVRLFCKKRNARKIFASFSSLAILRPCETRFGVMYLVLHRLLKVWNALQQTVVSDHWNSWKDSKQPDAINVKNYVLDPSTSSSFHIVLTLMGPLYTVLRLTDREGSTIGLLYEFMRRARDVLTKGVEADQVNKSKYEDVLKLYDKRAKWFKRPIHLVAHL